MELRQLEYFVAVAEERSFTRAAERVHVAQSGVSAQVGKLERELGQPLLDRSHRAVKTTAAGEAVLPLARHALDAVKQIRHALDELEGLTSGQVSVGMVTSSPPVVTDVLASFHERFPGVELTLTEAPASDVLRAVERGDLDLGFAALGPEQPTVDTQIISDVPIVAAVDTRHPLAERAKITLAELAEHPLISLPPGTGLRAILDDACARAGVTPKIAFEASDPRLLAEFARRGFGAAILPQPEATGLQTLELGLRGRFALAWHDARVNSPAARAFISHARGSFA
jgi:DNA-binding transcriptional LysR family regulator